MNRQQQRELEERPALSLDVLRTLQAEDADSGFSSMTVKALKEELRQLNVWGDTKADLIERVRVARIVRALERRQTSAPAGGASAAAASSSSSSLPDMMERLQLTQPTTLRPSHRAFCWRPAKTL